MTENTLHQPVLLKEVIEWLEPCPGQKFIDATLGFGGHTKEILKAIGQSGKLLALEKDEESLEKAKEYLPDQPNLILRVANFKDIEEVALKAKMPPVDGIIFDLGLSLWQIKNSGRGFSFAQNEPLDMRLDKNQTLTAHQVVNHFKEQRLYQILKDSDERYAKIIARAIVKARKIQPIRSSFSLAQIVGRVYAEKARRSYRQKINPATRTFQAIRMVVNEEVESLKKGLEGATAILKTGGRLAVISFHSGEDRVVKRFFKQSSALKILTKKPVSAQDTEVVRNPRSRSAKLRIGERVEEKPEVVKK